MGQLTAHARDLGFFFFSNVTLFLELLLLLLLDFRLLFSDFRDWVSSFSTATCFSTLWLLTGGSSLVFVVLPELVASKKNSNHDLNNQSHLLDFYAVQDCSAFDPFLSFSQAQLCFLLVVSAGLFLRLEFSLVYLRTECLPVNFAKFLVGYIKS